jgi:hypothetical protein
MKIPSLPEFEHAEPFAPAAPWLPLDSVDGRRDTAMLSSGGIMSRSVLDSRRPKVSDLTIHQLQTPKKRQVGPDIELFISRLMASAFRVLFSQWASYVEIRISSCNA